MAEGGHMLLQQRVLAYTSRTLHSPWCHRCSTWMFIFKLLQRHADGAVDAAGPLAAAHDEQRACPCRALKKACGSSLFFSRMLPRIGA